MSPEFANVFARLRRILQKYAGTLSVTDDTPTRYCIAGKPGPAAAKMWGGKIEYPIIPVAWVQVGKGYVSYHLMPVYANTPLRESMSQGLRARMQGKSCFNFKTTDEALFKELEDLTARGCRGFKQVGFIA